MHTVVVQVSDSLPNTECPPLLPWLSVRLFRKSASYSGPPLSRFSILD